MKREKDIMAYSVGNKLTDVVPRMPKKTNRIRDPPKEIELSHRSKNRAGANDQDVTGKGGVYNSNSNLFKTDENSSDNLEDV